MANKGHVFGRLLITTAMQGAAAPLVDRCRSEADGRVFWGVLILLTPLRRDLYGESLPPRGLVLGWTQARPSSAPKCFRCGKRVAIGKEGMLMRPDGERSHDCGENWMEEHGYAVPLSEEKPRG